MGLSFSDLFPGRFLKALDFKGKDVTLTITSVRLEELEGDGGKSMKAIVTFERTKKELVCNKTNALALRAMWGNQTDDWVGKRVTLYPAPISFGDNDLAIRVRGSPDLKANVTFDLKLARKKPKSVTLLKTSPGQVAVEPAPVEGSPVPVP